MLAGNIEQVADAWRADEAWRGTVRVGMEMPAATLGDIAYAVILLHAWDLARAAGAVLSVSADAAAALRRSVAETAELGRQMGVYAEAHSVGADAGDLEQALALAGRDLGGDADLVNARGRAAPARARPRATPAWPVCLPRGPPVRSAH